jgi:hypothetical protein
LLTVRKKCSGLRYKRERRLMMLVVERVQGRYEAQDVPFGKVYAWRSGQVILECDCGERLTINSCATVCECGLDHAATIREELDTASRSKDEALYPWRYFRSREDAGIPY